METGRAVSPVPSNPPRPETFSCHSSGKGTREDMKLSPENVTVYSDQELSICSGYCLQHATVPCCNMPLLQAFAARCQRDSPPCEGSTPLQLPPLPPHHSALLPSHLRILSPDILTFPQDSHSVPSTAAGEGTRDDGQVRQGLTRKPAF